MKIFVPKSNALTKAFLQTIQLSEGQNEVSSLEETEIVMTKDVGDLRKMYREDRFFGLLATDFKHVAKNQPDNVFVLDAANLLTESGSNSAFAFKAAIQKWIDGQASASAPRVQPEISSVAKLSRSYSVLVIDDKHENLELTMRVLPGQKMVLATGPEEAMKYLNLPGQTFDAVLTDMHMRPDRLYGSLNIDAFGITETIPYGFAVILEATMRGIPVAVVTDGNHHQDWVVAMMSKISTATVNGQKVILLNRSPKRWDEALKLLMEQ